MAQRPLYIHLYHLHGLFRAKNLELGRDADTGGQTKYVLELAKTLGKHPDVDRVDVITRRIEDDAVDPDYARPIEHINKKARIVRIRCGGRRYRRKELLWPHLDEFVDNCIRFIRSQNRIPDIIHAHYADAGYVGTQLARLFGLPLVFTGHSLGRSKLSRLQADGMSAATAERRFNIMQRIQAEELTLRYANLVVTSTQQEQEEQYAQYDAPLRASAVIPPGIDLDIFRAYNRGPRDRKSVKTRRALYREFERFHIIRSKPMILALSRPDRRKNISALVHAYGSDPDLKDLANLAIFAGIRKDIREMPDNEREVLTDLLLLMDRYDLYGRMALPKRHDFETEVPELYRIAARTGGVFVNPALTEPFGLTLIEAAASGLPVVATNDGGPREIIENCRHGLLVEPTDPQDIAAAIKHVIAERDRWDQYSRQGMEGVARHYAWQAHTQNYIEVLEKKVSQLKPYIVTSPREIPIGQRLQKAGQILITDIDDTLIGDEDSLSRLIELLHKKRDNLAFGVATGRTVDSAREVLAEYGVPDPDVVISSVGAEIYFGSNDEPDSGWARHISYQWKRDQIAKLLVGIPGLELQEKETQRPHKLSYYIDDKKFDPDELLSRLRSSHCRYNTIISGENAFLDFLPQRASKGRAVRYLAYKWNIPHQCIVVAGDSGNDREMLVGRLLGVVVANYSPDLEDLRGSRRRDIYFSSESYAGGIIDGLFHYGFVEEHELDRVERAKAFAAK